MVVAGLLVARALLATPRGEGLVPPPRLVAYPTLIYSGEPVNVSWSGISPGPTDFIVGSYNTSAGIGSFDFYRSVLYDGPPPPFVFRPVNMRTGYVTFRYIRDFLSGPFTTGYQAVSRHPDDLGSGKVLPSRASE